MKRKGRLLKRLGAAVACMWAGSALGVCAAVAGVISILLRTGGGSALVDIDHLELLTAFLMGPFLVWESAWAYLQIPLCIILIVSCFREDGLSFRWWAGLASGFGIVVVIVIGTDSWGPTWLYWVVAILLWTCFTGALFVGMVLWEQRVRRKYAESLMGSEGDPPDATPLA